MLQPVAADDLRGLPVAERLRLIDERWDAMDQEADARPLADWQHEEIDKHRDGLDQGRTLGAPRDELPRRIIAESQRSRSSFSSRPRP